MTAPLNDEFGTSEPDAAALRRASRTVGLQIALASSVLVVLAIATAFTFVFAHIEPSKVLDGREHGSTVDVDAFELLVAAVVIGVAAVVVAGLLSWFIARRAIRPLGEALRIQRSFVANASHELRTPLAVLDARLQLLQRGMASDDPSATTVTELRRDTGILVQIVNDLLVTAEQDAQQPAVATVEVAPIAELAVESMRVLAAERGVAITLDAAPVGVLVPAASVHRCIVALLDNALRFAPRDSEIAVSVRAERNTVELRVTDRGAGISGIEPDRVFERFARGTGAVADGGDAGVGIGLALVRDTVSRYGGSALVERTGPQGTTMLLRLPRARRG